MKSYLKIWIFFFSIDPRFIGDNNIDFTAHINGDLYQDEFHPGFELGRALKISKSGLFLEGKLMLINMTGEGDQVTAIGLHLGSYF